MKRQRQASSRLFQPILPTTGDVYPLAGMATAYWFLSVIGLQWAQVGGAGSPVWPAAGVALAGLLLGGVRLWPAIMAGRLIAGLTVESQQPLWTELIIAVGNTFAAVLPVLVLAYSRIDLRLTGMRDILWLSVASAISAAIAAAFGIGALWLSSGFGLETAFAVATGWWFGNTVGMLTVAPLTLAWSVRQAWAFSPASAAHFVSMLFCVAALSYLIFLSPAISPFRTWLVFPVLIWAALAFKVRGAALAVTIASGLAIWGANFGLGPFLEQAEGVAVRILLAQQFSAVASLTVLILGAVADERRATEALKESEERFRLLVDGVRDHALYLLDPNGRLSTWNSAAERLTGWRAQEITGQHFGIFFTPEDREAGAPELELQEARRNGVHVTEGARLRKDGSEFIAQVATTALFGEAGELRGFAKITRDVTERRQAEQALLESERKLQTLISNLPGIAYRRPIAEAWSLSYASDGVLDLTGRPASEIMAEEGAWGRLIHPDDRERIRAEAKAALSKHNTFELMYRIRHADGGLRWVLDRGRGIFDDATGAPLAIEGFVGDLTRQYEAEERLRRRSEQLQKLAEAALAVARAPDLQTMVEEVTEAAKRIIGASEAGLRIAALSSQGSEEGCSLDNGDSVLNEVEEHKSITRRYGSFQADEWRVPLIGRDGHELGVLQVAKPRGADFDGTDEAVLVQLAQLASAAIERSQAEAALRRLNIELEQAVDEKTADLIQLQKMETLGQLTGGIAHDFNNLLMAVLGSLELLKKRLPVTDERASRLLDNAVEGAQRGVGLTKRLLAFARKQELSPRPVSVPDLVVGMSDLLQRSLGPQIAIETRFALHVPKAWMDPHQLELAILNLTVNASDAMSDGGTLTIEVNERRTDGRQFVLLSVSDTGSGMDEATLRRATEPFFTTKGPGKGTGLGLPMVLGLIDQSGGHIQLISEPGTGTTVELLLPVAQKQSTSPALGQPGVAESPLSGPSTPINVLVVDDDALVLMGTAAMLEDLGHEVISVSSGEQAIAVLKSGTKVDLVVTDQAMPGMTGLQLSAAIRAEWPDLPIVLATGYSELPQGAEEPPAQRLNKPFQQQELAAALMSALGRAQEATGTATVLPFRSRSNEG